MFVADDPAGPSVIYSASDLAAAAGCEYALLSRFDAKLGRGEPHESVEDEMLARTAELGTEHEQRVLADLIATHGSGGRGVVQIPSAAYSVAALRRAAEATEQAFAARPAVIYQAAVFHGRFAGFADFLIRDGEPDDAVAYRVVDTKLARRAKVTALLQIAGYADALAAAGIAVAPRAQLILGNRDVVEYPVADLIPVFRRQRDKLQTLLDDHLASGAPVSWRDPSVGACMRCEFCLPHVVEDDDLLLVAGMRVTQRAALIDAGIDTVAALAASTQPVPDVAASTLSGLRTQARLQVAQRDAGTPQFEIADPEALGALPAKSRGDLFFDFEGDPLWTDDGITWGLEYMWGVLDVRDNFRPLWAQDRPSERKAFLDFLAMVRTRRDRHPDMHIYHYAAYERSTLLRLAARYGVGEDEVDDLLRSDVLVDLFPIVRNSLRVGAPSYSLKALEPLYMGAELRTGEVTNAASSITQYAHYRTLLDAGRADEAAAVLKEITDYNLYDCRSTRRLRDWLLLRAFESGVTHLTRPGEGGEPVPPLDDVAEVLLGFAGDGFSAPRTPEQSAAALLESARGYYQRERKPYWWAHFHRLSHPVDEWDTSGVFLIEEAEVVQDWHLPPRARKPRRHVRVRGVLEGGQLDGRPQILYDRPAPAGLDDEHPDRRASWNAEVLDVTDVEGVPVEVLICELQPESGPHDHLPMALTPARPIRTAKIEESIAALATEAAQTLSADPPVLPRCAVVDLLCRRPPTTLSGADQLPRLDNDVDSITAAVLDLDRSYLAVHGPPGTGKTFTAARVIATLVNTHRWKIGVVAQSHAVVAHLLDAVDAAGVDAARVAKKAGRDGLAGRFTTIPDSGYADFLDTDGGCVLGGTAWDFANDTRVPPAALDLLAIDEAGQFSLGNTIAVARATRSLLLLGDPQQLGQVSTGSHPEPVDESALGWLMTGHDVLPAEFGYFLARSHRMHPAVCRAVSALSYENRLLPHPSAERRGIEGHAPGVHTLVVEHHGNTASSVEEAEAITAAVTDLLGAPWTTEAGTRPLAAADVLVVAPYNAQVLTLQGHLESAGLGEVLVGTVDKLQGRQAPVVFVSMTASALDDVPRGMPFLLNRNRLNVAISRAQCLTVIVRSPALTDHLPTTPDGLVDLGAFLALSPGQHPSVGGPHSAIAGG
ncbi:TM0106 family RecB-like putative nuclease [Mycobacterium sp. ACS4331]|uniref:TM0106 family RecB-like putative nuclease n=1 Tax=Mycobacterium sp. ACS4331 TaxID=1834121 RepID=UPI0007FF2657|nr:TM0106 family RecB-like putative nuclease [Mycobacterium sp. ACS4331]OBF27434.1 nuclease [Mycobacterium sp. ACS4331]